MVELLFATSKIGAVAVPLNWRLAPAELEAIVADAGAREMIAGASYRQVAPADREPPRRRLEVLDTGEAMSGACRRPPPTDPGHRGAASDVAVQMYTSGTTGPSKGVLTTQRNLAAAYLSADVWAFDPDR